MSERTSAVKPTGVRRTILTVLFIVTPIVIGYILRTTGSSAWALTFVACAAAVALFSMLVVVGEIGRVQPERSLLHPTAEI